MNERQKRIIVDTAGISLTLIASVIYVFIGAFWGLWHPYWIIIAGIIGLSAAAKIMVEANIKIEKIKYEEELNRLREQEEKEAQKLKLLVAPKQIKTKEKNTTKPVVKIDRADPINVDDIIAQKKAELRKKTLGVDIKETKTSSIKEQTVKLTKPKTQKIVEQTEVKAEPFKKVSATKTTTTKTPATKTTNKKVSTTAKTPTTAKSSSKTKTASATAKKTTTKTTATKKANSTAKKVVKK